MKHGRMVVELDKIDTVAKKDGVERGKECTKMYIFLADAISLLLLQPFQMLFAIIHPRVFGSSTHMIPVLIPVHCLVNQRRDERKQTRL